MKRKEFIIKAALLLLLTPALAAAEGCNMSKYVSRTAYKDPFTSKLAHALFVNPDLFKSCTPAQMNTFLQAHPEVAGVVAFKKLTLDNVTDLVGVLNQNSTIDNAWLSGQELGDDLATQMASAKYIKYLELFMDNLTVNAAKSLATNTSIQWLVVDNNNMGDEGAAILTSMPQVTYLSMAGNDLTDNSAAYFANDRSLRRLNVDYNYQFTDATAALIVSNPNIHSLVIGSNQMTDMGVTTLVNDKKLRHLAIDNIFYASKSSPNTINALANNTTLRSVVLTSDSLTDNDLQQLSVNKTLRHIDITSNNVTDAGVLALLSDPSLSSLGLDSTEVMQPASYQAIAASNLKKLAIVNIQDSPKGDLTADNVNALAGGHYSSLVLSGCGITDDEVPALVAMSNLRHLEVDSNDIHDAGADLLAKTTNLHYLDISFNFLSSLGVAALEANKNIRNLNTQGEGSHTPAVKSNIKKVHHKNLLENIA